MGLMVRRSTERSGANGANGATVVGGQGSKVVVVGGQGSKVVLLA